MKIAIVHEWLTTFGGSERILVECLRLFPQADVFALIHFPQNFENTELRSLKTRASFLQSIPRIEKHYRKLLALMPLAIESLDVSQYDLVISLSHAVAHGVKTHRRQTHISYISTPMRYAWHMREEYLNLHGLNRPFIRPVADLTLNLLRRWDKFASARSDSLIANSSWTVSHIREAWRRDSHVIHPPVDVVRFAPAASRDDYYLFVSRLVPYKMSVEIVRAFNMLGLPLVLIGNGSDLPAIRSMAKDNIKVMGYQPDSVVTELMNRAKAFVYMATEDFGIAMVEAQAAGCPVIAYYKGGASEIVRDGETGLLFKTQSAEGLVEAVTHFERMNLNSKAASSNAARFSEERFRREFISHIKNQLKR
ncbi:MAG: glycosyltransferase [Anaerolineales bacterium]|nr:glycosyltransferase [Anaerolineales bacterium]